MVIVQVEEQCGYASFWNIPDTKVVCRQLGYDGEGHAFITVMKYLIIEILMSATQTYTSASYGEGFGPGPCSV